MKVFIIFIALVNFSLAVPSTLLSHKPDNYLAVTSDDSDFAKIISNEIFEYWECVYNPTMLEPIKAKRYVVSTSGNLKYARLAKRISSRSGFFVSCGPAFCSYYIVAIRKDKSVCLINTKSAFRSFVGKIDNIEEAKLTLRNNGFNVNPSLQYQSSYARIGDNYMFKIYNYGLQNCFSMQPGIKPLMVNVKVIANGDCFKL